MRPWCGGDLMGSKASLRSSAKSEATRESKDRICPLPTLFPFPTLSLPQHRHIMATATSLSHRIGKTCPARGGGAPLKSLALFSLLLASLPDPTASTSSSPDSRPHRKLISKDAAISKAACFGSYPRYVSCVCC
jgi:hypothetical protein